MFELLLRRGSKSIPPDMAYSEELRSVLRRTVDEADRLQTLYVGAEHLVLAMLSNSDSEASRIFSAVGLRGTEFRAQLETVMAAPSGTRLNKKRGPRSIDVPWTNKARLSLMGAIEQAQELKQSPVSSGHLLLSVLANAGSVVVRLLTDRGVTLSSVRDLVRRGVGPTAILSIQLDDDSDRLIYQQIVVQIQESIATGQLAAGQRLPPIRQLADELNIAPGTVARAYNELETAGIVITDRARGTFVAGPKQVTPEVPPIVIRDLLRPVVVTAFHLGSSAKELREALTDAMADIYPHTV